MLFFLINTEEKQVGKQSMQLNKWRFYCVGDTWTSHNPSSGAYSIFIFILAQIHHCKFLVCVNLLGHNTRSFKGSSVSSSNMSEALTRQIKDLEAELEKLRSQLRERGGSGEDMEVRSSENTDHKPHGKSGGCKKGKKATKERPFDFSLHPRRHAALRLAYMGWAYQGFAVQENTDNTVEARLFEALLKTRLIQDRQSSNYHRCGRTDKGVSAFSQVSSQRRRSCTVL